MSDHDPRKDKYSTTKTIDNVATGPLKIKNAAIMRIRKDMFGPTAKPTLRDRALQFCSLNTIVKMEWLVSDDRTWN